MEPFKITLVDNTSSSMSHSHFHENYEIYFLLEGERSFFIKDRTYSIKPGDIVFLSPKVIHRSLVDRPAHVKRYVIMIPKDYVHTIALDYTENIFQCFQNGSPIHNLCSENVALIHNQFAKIRKEYESDSPHKGFILPLLVSELLFYLNRFHTKEKKPLEETSDSISQEAIKYMLKNFTSSISLEELSENLYISTFQLCRIFKSETGFTVMEYLTFVRLREAMHLLDTSKDSITDIGFNVGFNNTNHFIRTFKKHLGTTPKQYQLNRR